MDVRSLEPVWNDKERAERSDPDKWHWTLLHVGLIGC